MDKEKIIYKEKWNVLRGYDVDGNVVLKRCSVCRVLKLLKDFSKSKGSVVDGKCSYCKVCENYHYETIIKGRDGDRVRVRKEKERKRNKK